MLLAHSSHNHYHPPPRHSHHKPTTASVLLSPPTLDSRCVLLAIYTANMESIFAHQHQTEKFLTAGTIRGISELDIGVPIHETAQHTPKADYADASRCGRLVC